MAKPDSNNTPPSVSKNINPRSEKTQIWVYLTPDRPKTRIWVYPTPDRRQTRTLVGVSQESCRNSQKSSDEDNKSKGKDAGQSLVRITDHKENKSKVTDARRSRGRTTDNKENNEAEELKAELEQAEVKIAMLELELAVASDLDKARLWQGRFHRARGNAPIVMVRIRPQLEAEVGEGEGGHGRAMLSWRANEHEGRNGAPLLFTLYRRAEALAQDWKTGNNGKTKSYDTSMDSCSVSVDHVFEPRHGNDSVKNELRVLLDGVVGGQRQPATPLAIMLTGQSGSGKTFTFSGLAETVIERIFDQGDHGTHGCGDEDDKEGGRLGGWEMACLEVYNNKTRDLLLGEKKINQESEQDNTYRRRTSGDPSFLPWTTSSKQPLTIHKPPTVQDAMGLVRTGWRRRTMSPTKANASSSRSHVILYFFHCAHRRHQLAAASAGSGPETEKAAHAVILVDLAGEDQPQGQWQMLGSDGVAGVGGMGSLSALEPASGTGSGSGSSSSVEKDRGQESGQINKSLSVVGRLMACRARGRQAAAGTWRETSLTQVLQPLLHDRKSQECWIVTLSPNEEAWRRNVESLRFAEMVRGGEGGGGGGGGGGTASRRAWKPHGIKVSSGKTF